MSKIFYRIGPWRGLRLFFLRCVEHVWIGVGAGPLVGGPGDLLARRFLEKMESGIAVLEYKQNWPVFDILGKIRPGVS